MRPERFVACTRLLCVGPARIPLLRPDRSRARARQHGTAGYYAVETYNQVRIALERLDESGEMLEVPSRFQDDPSGELP